MPLADVQAAVEGFADDGGVEYYKPLLGVRRATVARSFGEYSLTLELELDPTLDARPALDEATWYLEDRDRE